MACLGLLSLYAGRGRWSERATIALVMQMQDDSLSLFPERGLLGRVGVTSRQGHGLPDPTWIPAVPEALERTSAHIDGFAGTSVVRSPTSP